nr:C-X-C motif chemokine 17 [Oryctolagus cuniculus]
MNSEEAWVPPLLQSFTSQIPVKHVVQSETLPQRQSHLTCSCPGIKAQTARPSTPPEPLQEGSRLRPGTLGILLKRPAVAPMAPEKVLIPSLLLLLSLLLMPTVSSNPHSGVARGHGDQRQTSGRWLWEDGQECECKGWFLRAPKRKLMTVPRLPKKHCPCDHFKGTVKKTRGHQKSHRQPNKHSRACQQFLKRCQLASFALPL